MPTVELFFDASSESRIRDLSNQFASFESPIMRESSVRPHITLLACDSVDVAAASTFLERIATVTPSFAVSLGSFGLFPAPLPVAFLAPKVTSDLLALQARILAEFSPLAAGCSSLYSPGQWIPHCTIALELSPQHLGFALDVCRTFGIPLACIASEIGLVDYSPCRQLIRSLSQLSGTPDQSLQPTSDIWLSNEFNTHIAVHVRPGQSRLSFFSLDLCPF